jgi:predicted nucleic acid-binding protein
VVFLQAAVNEGSSAGRILDLLDEGRIELYVSKRILAEIRYTLDRTDLRSSIKGLTDLAVEGLFERLEKKTTFIKQIQGVLSIRAIQKTSLTLISPLPRMPHTL